MSPAPDKASKKIDYQHSGAYDRPTFEREFNARFGRSARYNAAAVPEMMKLVGLIEKDAAITDVRQAAYMLATVMWETTSPTKVTEVARNKKGVPLLDKHKHPILVTRRRWQITMAPVSEVGQGQGRRYHEAVKVKRLADGSVRITEQDGDQFSISPAGAIKKLTKHAKMGSPAGGPVSQVYEDDDGDEHAYYGRGYVQLTWWSNYAASGIAIGRGLDLLLDPELVKNPEVAYALMSHGMLTGQGFANGHKFSRYFVADHTRYREARHMVNGSDHAEDIAALARQFEAALLAARVSKTPPETPSTQPLQLPLP